jgi:hypothetical protein
LSVRTITTWVTMLLVVVGIGIGVEAGIGVGTPAGTARYGKGCGVTALAGGPGGAVGVKRPALLHECPSGPLMAIPVLRVRGLPAVRLVSNSGAMYPIERFDDTGWSAILPVGIYRAVDAPGCTAEKPFDVTAGRTTLGIIILWGCGYR